MRTLLIYLAFSIFSPSVDLVFVGDMMQHLSQVQSAKNTDGGYDYSECFEHLEPLLKAANLAVVNMETCFYTPPYTGYPAFNSPREAAIAMREAGANIFLAANNHILDRGGAGLRSTLDLYDSLGVYHLGAYRDSAERAQKHPLLIDTLNMRIAMLNYTYGTNGIPNPAPYVVNRIDTLMMASEILKARHKKADFIICCIHWGEEYKLQANEHQKDLEQWLYSKGVDIIIGGHPHVPQSMNIERMPYGPVRHFTAYSLGNLISNMTAKNTRMGLLVGLSLNKSPLIEAKAIHSVFYEWLWTWRPKRNNKTSYVILPVSRPEYGASFFESDASFGEMNIYLKALRNFMKKTAPEIPERCHQTSL